MSVIYLDGHLMFGSTPQVLLVTLRHKVLLTKIIQNDFLSGTKTLRFVKR